MEWKLKNYAWSHSNSHSNSHPNRFKIYDLVSIGLA